MKDLKLYYRPMCPYCRKVLRFAEDNGIELEKRNIAEPENYRRLVDVGGDEQVPCLFIDGRPLYESDDIIAFLKREYAV